jgi:hypothetical protein
MMGCQCEHLARVGSEHLARVVSEQDARTALQSLVDTLLVGCKD